MIGEYQFYVFPVKDLDSGLFLHQLLALYGYNGLLMCYIRTRSAYLAKTT